MVQIRISLSFPSVHMKGQQLIIQRETFMNLSFQTKTNALKKII